MLGSIDASCLALVAGSVLYVAVFAGMAADTPDAGPTSREGPAKTKDLPMPQIGVRQEDAAPVYGTWTFVTDTVRRKLPAIADKPGDPRNNPPWIQNYSAAWLPVRPAPSGASKTWYVYSPDRYTIPVMGVVSRDRKWLTAIATDSADVMTQAWQQCLHNNPKWLPAKAPPAERRWRVKIYFMPNDPDALLERVAADFPDAVKLKEKRKEAARP